MISILLNAEQAADEKKLENNKIKNDFIIRSSCN